MAGTTLRKPPKIYYFGVCKGVKMNECVLEQDTLLILPFLVSTWENLLIALKMKGQQYV